MAILQRSIVRREHVHSETYRLSILWQQYCLMLPFTTLISGRYRIKAVIKLRSENAKSRVDIKSKMRTVYVNH